MYSIYPNIHSTFPILWGMFFTSFFHPALGKRLTVFFSYYIVSTMQDEKMTKQVYENERKQKPLNAKTDISWPDCVPFEARSKDFKLV